MPHEPSERKLIVAPLVQLPLSRDVSYLDAVALGMFIFTGGNRRTQLLQLSVQPIRVVRLLVWNDDVLRTPKQECRDASQAVDILERAALKVTLRDIGRKSSDFLNDLLGGAEGTDFVYLR